MPRIEKVDAWCQGIERIGNSLIFTIEIDDLPDIAEAEKLARAALAAGKKIDFWKVAGVMLYINRVNRLIEQGKIE